MASGEGSRRAEIHWEGDARAVLREWPHEMRNAFGLALRALQEGEAPLLAIRPMKSIAAGVFELKSTDERKWYRLIYLARVRDTIHVLHCFTKHTAKTERRDLSLAEQRWKRVQQKLRGAIS